MNHWPVIHDRFPYLPIHLQIRSRDFDLEALLDTGYDGVLLLPHHVVGDDMPADGTVTLVLADGSEIEAAAYCATVEIGAARIDDAVVTIVGDVPLIGISLIRRFAVTLDHGERVIVEP